MSISPSYPFNLQNGTTADATQVMANLLQVQNDINANAAHNGVNSDITQLAGLTTPLTPAQGGTGVTSLAALFTALAAAPLASPAFTGTPTAPTAAPGTSTTQLATTAFVATSYAPLASPALTGVPTAPTAAPGTSTTQLATCAFVSASSFAAATQAEMEAATSIVVAATPGRTQYHPGVAKAWVKFAGASGTIAASYNVTSVTKNGTGDYTVNFTTPFSSGNYTMAPAGTDNAISNPACISFDYSNLPTTSAARVTVRNDGGGLFDTTMVTLTFFGDQ